MKLKILVPFRIGRDLENLTEEEWRRIAGGEMDLNYLQKQLNPSDEAALEQALLLRDAWNGCGEVTGLYLGDDSIDGIAKNLYAVGLKEIVQLPAPPDLDPLSAAKWIEKFCLERGPFDLILMGCTEYPFDFGVTQTLLAEGLGIPLSEVYGVASFYAQFTMNPKGKYQISVCLGTACYVKGAAAILNAVEQKLGIVPGSITPDGKFSLDSCRCVGACGLAPVMMINSDVYGRLTPDQVGAILDNYK